MYFQRLAVFAMLLAMTMVLATATALPRDGHLVRRQCNVAATQVSLPSGKETIVLLHEARLGI